MKTEVITLTPVEARRLLQRNTKNRKFNETTVKNYVKEMQAGRWKENGESIIIDSSGIVKDGQHRLMACIESNYSFNVVMVTDVNSDVMHTIDIGKNRTFKDVLELNNFKYASLMASTVTRIIKYNKNKKTIYNLDRNTSSTNNYISNSFALDYASKNEDNLVKLCRNIDRIYSKTKKIISKTDLCFYLYLTGRYNYNDTHLDFISHITGISYERGTPTAYVFDTLYNSKQKKAPLNAIYKINLVIRAWDLFQSGNAPVRYLRVDATKLLEV
jgi:hypothetical protein